MNSHTRSDQSITDCYHSYTFTNFSILRNMYQVEAVNVSKPLPVRAHVRAYIPVYIVCI